MQPIKNNFIIAVLILVVSTVKKSWTNNAVENPIVKTEYGDVKGTVRYSNGNVRPVYSFFGVPYGRCPDYMFRFVPPEDPWTWNNVRDTSDEFKPPICEQDEIRLKQTCQNTPYQYLLPKNYSMSENCLTLDIFTPNLSTKETKKLPVIVWIHGGSFQVYASSRKLWGLPSMENVVLVQVQYRLGPFGFFTSEDKWAVQNVAYHDHIKALKWVKNNIEEFGGDPLSVTLMGMSAGSLAVTAHMLSPLSAGLFHKAIALSGSIGTINFNNHMAPLAKRVAKRLECDFQDPIYYVTCVQNKISSKKLVKACRDEKAVFTNIDGGDFMPYPAESLVKSRNFSNNVPLIIGATNGEFDFLLPYRYNADFYELGSKTTKQDCVNYLKKILPPRYPGLDVSKLIQDVVDEYLENEEDSLNLHRNTLSALADDLFVSKAHRFAEALQQTGQLDVYFYQFSRRPDFYQGNLFKRPYKSNRADHGDGFTYLFGIPFLKDSDFDYEQKLPFTKSEKKFSANIMHLIAQFAKTGSPNASNKASWNPFPSYVNFINDTMVYHKGPFSKKRMSLWNQKLPSK